jgi:hypothetical protein
MVLIRTVRHFGAILIKGNQQVQLYKSLYPDARIPRSWSGEVNISALSHISDVYYFRSNQVYAVDETFINVNITKKGEIGNINFGTYKKHIPIHGIDYDPLGQLSLGLFGAGGVAALSKVSVGTLAGDFSYATTYAYVRGSAMLGQGAAYTSSFSESVGYAFGPIKQWVRVGPSYSHYLSQATRLSIRWGASPTKNWTYVNQIGSPTLRILNQSLIMMRLPIPNWRYMDPGYIHLKK